MRIIDSHVHLFDHIGGIFDGQPVKADRLGQVRVGNRLKQLLPPAFENSDSRAETLVRYMDWCGVEKALLMPNPQYGYFNAYFEKAVALYPDRLRGVAMVDVLKGEAAARELQQVYDTTCLFGFKIEVNCTFQCAKEKHLLSPELQPVFDCCDQNHQPVFIHMLYREDIGRVKRLAQQYPHITWVLCHMGADACFAHGYDQPALDEVLAFANSRDNVFLETSTVEFYFEEDYPFPLKTSILEKAYRAVGAQRIMWGSDYPGLLVKGTYRQLIDVVAAHCPGIPLSAREQILGGTAWQLFFAENAVF